MVLGLDGTGMDAVVVKCFADLYGYWHEVVITGCHHMH